MTHRSSILLREGLAKAFRNSPRHPSQFCRRAACHHHPYELIVVDEPISIKISFADHLIHLYKRLLLTELRDPFSWHTIRSLPTCPRASVSLSFSPRFLGNERPSLMPACYTMLLQPMGSRSGNGIIEVRNSLAEMKPSRSRSNTCHSIMGHLSKSAPQLRRASSYLATLVILQLALKASMSSSSVSVSLKLEHCEECLQAGCTPRCTKTSVLELP